MKAAISPSAVDRLEQVEAPIQAEVAAIHRYLHVQKCAQSFLRSVQYEEIDLPWSGGVIQSRSMPFPRALYAERLWFYENSLGDRGTMTAQSILLILLYCSFDC